MNEPLEIQDLGLSSEELARRLNALNEIGIALTSKKDFEPLLETILQKAKEFTDAEGGTIFIRKDDTLQFALGDNEEISSETWTQHVQNESLPISRDSIAGYAASTGTIVNIPDVYDIPSDAEYDFESRFDEALNYRTRSLIAVPLQNIEGKILGVLMLVNARGKDGSVKRFPEEEEPLLRNLASHAAVALTHVKRYRKQSRRITQLQEKYSRMQTNLQRQYQYDRIIGESDEMQEVYSVLDKVIPTSLNVIVEGETGTGKELVSRAIHYNGPRKDEPFLAVNCGRFSSSILESELFGHEKGAFTGATETKAGLFEQADGGTLFLDEIGDMSSEMQARLLRVLENQTVRRVGGEEVHEVDVRIVSASNRSLSNLVEQGIFRKDLYYRLADAKITLPPLRKRKEDIPLLVERFLDEIAEEQNQEKKSVEDSLLKKLMKKEWPGNVRQLRSAVRRMALFSGNQTIISEDDYQEVTDMDPEPDTPSESSDGSSQEDSASEKPSREFRFLSEERKKEVVEETLRETGGNKSKAADQLGISRSTLYKYLD